MGLKKILKRVFGEQRLSNIKGFVMHHALSAEFAVKRKSKIWIDTEKFKVAYHLSEKGFHLFRGYYDLQYLSQNGNRFLVHRLPLKAKDNRKTKVEIGYYDLNTKEFHKVSESSAWCWQQGSRLRYHPMDQNKILFNDVEGNRYCTKIIDVETGEKTILCEPLYDISQDFSWGLSLNFSRLQRKRPGYGYNYFSDETNGINAPENDGVFYVDIKNNTSILKHSLKDLAENAGISEDNEFYVNHISISPDGKKYIFFLIYTNQDIKDWKTVLFLDDGILHILEKNDRVSHYCWIENESIMVSCHREDGTEYYCIFDVQDGSKKIIDNDELISDGHPSPLGKGFITDTYPLEKSLQKILTFELYNSRTEIIAKLYHDFRMRGEKRCDLHPAVENGGRFLSVDTTYHKGRRNVLILENLGNI